MKKLDFKKITFLVIIFFVFLFWSGKALADPCNLEGWNKEGDCTVDISYSDPTGGSGLLDECLYTVESGVSPTCPANGGAWNSASCPSGCGGQTTANCQITISIGEGEECGDNGNDTCVVCAKAVDYAGNEGYASANLDIDYSFPSTNITCNGEECLPGWYNQNVSVALFCSDEGSGCEKTYYCIDQANGCDPDPFIDGLEYTVLFEMTEEGIYYVRYYSTDVAGNEETIKSKEVKIDYSIPSVGEISPTTVLQNENVTLSAAGTDEISGIEQCFFYVENTHIGGAVVNYTQTPCKDCTISTNHTFSEVKDYENVFFLCVDGASNYNEISPVTIHVVPEEDIPPTVEVRAFEGETDITEEVDDIWRNTDVTAKVICEDEVGGSGCNENSYKLEKYDPIYETIPDNCPIVCDEYNIGASEAVPVGSHQYICGTAKDHAGNEGFSDPPLEFLVDKIEPVIEILDPPTPSQNSWQNDDFDFKFRASDDGGSGLKECSYIVTDFNGGTTGEITVSCGESVGFTVPVGTEDMCKEDRTGTIGEATCYVQGKAYDNAGNSGAGSRRYKIDYTPPLVGEVPLEERSATQGEPKTFYASLSDEIGKVTGCWAFIDKTKNEATEALNASFNPKPCENGENCEISFEHTFIEEGEYYMRFKCKDAAGNLGVGNWVSIQVGEGPNPDAPVITDLTYYTCHCNTPETECASQFNCCLEPTTQDGCCVKFNVEAVDPNGDALSYSWSFGDGNTADIKSPNNHFSAPSDYDVFVTVYETENPGSSDSEVLPLTVADPTHSVSLTANPAFGFSSICDVDLSAYVSGTAWGRISYKFYCLEGESLSHETGVVSENPKEIQDLCDYEGVGIYNAKVIADRETESAEDTAEIKIVDSVCEYDPDPALNECTTCTSPQGCSHIICCKSDGTWPNCSIDNCRKGITSSCGFCGTQTCNDSCQWNPCVGGGDCPANTQNCPQCPCPPDGSNGCEWSEYGDCNENCMCEPCEPITCNDSPICNHLSVDNDNPFVGQPIIFSGYGYDNDGSINEYEFDFDDGTKIYCSEGPTSDPNCLGDLINGYQIGYVYGSEDFYYPKLRVEDDKGAWSEYHEYPCEDCCTQQITVTENIPPIAAISCYPSSCIGYVGSGFQLINESYDLDSDNCPDPCNSDIVNSVWAITGPESFTHNCIEINSEDPVCSITKNFLAGEYEAELFVTDGDAYNTVSQPFTIIADASADFMCSLTNEYGSWQNCEEIFITEGETVYFRDKQYSLEEFSEPDSTLIRTSTASPEATIEQRIWSKNGTPFDEDNNSNPSLTLEQGIHMIKLEITDTAGRTDDQDYEIRALPSLPDWWEGPPF